MAVLSSKEEAFTDLWKNFQYVRHDNSMPCLLETQEEPV